MSPSEIPFLSASALAESIRRREVSPVEATQAYLDRIEAIDGQLNSYITVCGDEALAAARQAEDAIARGESLGPLHGVPFAVKDQFWTKDLLTTGGSIILSDFVPDEDATVVGRLRQAGGILLGKLNMSEFATGNSVHHPYGQPHNPWDLARHPAPPAAGRGRPRLPSCAPRLLARTRAAPYATPPTTAGWWAYGPHGVWSAATGCWEPRGPWTSVAPSPAPWRIAP